MWRYYLNNPIGRSVQDCTVRALSKALNLSWDDAHKELSEASRQMGTMMHDNSVMDAILRRNGFLRKNIPNYCPECYSVEEFCEDHPKGLYVLGTGTHVVTVIDGDWFDSWNSGYEVPLYYWYKEKNNGRIL